MAQAVDIRARERFGETALKRSIGGEGFRAELVILHGDDAYDFSWDGDAHYLALHDVMLADGETVVGSRRLETPRDLSSLTFAPRGCAISGWSKPGRRTNSFVALTFSAELLARETGLNAHLSDIRPELYFTDSKLAGTLGKMQRLLVAPDPAQRLEAEALALLAALEFYGRSRLPLINAMPTGGLKPQQAAQLREYIAENLARELTLDSLASLVGLSRFHFSRSFKTTFGASPQQYVIEQRMERAKMLLASGDGSVGEIAGRVGYNGLARFSAAFRDVVGCSPSEYRRQNL